MLGMEPRDIYFKKASFEGCYWYKPLSQKNSFQGGYYKYHDIPKQLKCYGP
jgi:hypothetical protein